MHAQNQVYEKDLTSGIERRITFQNGSTFQPHYLLKEAFIIYSSSTDELKENPSLLHPGTADSSKMPFPYQEQMEIYAHSLHGFDIVRLTEHPGFDGEARAVEANDITFTRALGLKTEILRLNRATRAIHEIKGLGVNPTQYVSAPNGKAHAWIEWDENFAVSKLHVQKGKDKPLEIGPDMIVTKGDPSFSPDSKFLFWAQKEAEGAVYDLWIVDLETLCPRRLTQNKEGQRRDPQLSPDLNWLVYTVASQGRSRIARMAFVPPTGSCPIAP